MWVAAAHSPSGWVLRPLDGAGRLTGEPVHSPLPAHPAAPGARVVWASTSQLYPGVLAAGAEVERCHDLGAVRRLLDNGSSLGAAGDPAPPPAHPGLFDPSELVGAPGPDAAPAADDPEAIAREFTAQRREVEERRARFGGFGLLAAAESACTLAAAEMTHVGLPWRADVHDRLLEADLGPRPRFGGRPARLQDLADQVCSILGAPTLNVDSLPDLLRALHRAGVPVRSTRAWELRRVDHPVIGPLLRYRELARLFSAHGWAWREQWVRGGRFRPEYVPAGVVSGRWASRGGGALQIPKAVREAVVADDGWRLVVADAGQLEPRVLAALARDRAMLDLAASSPDLYTAVTRRLFGDGTPERPPGTRRAATGAGPGTAARDDPARLRDEVKIAFLSAMYGGGTGSPALAALRREFPAALDLLETAAGTGETGGVVHSVLGRPSPGAPPDWFGPDETGAERSSERMRARGRFTRNFVIQASAADWANVLIALLRLELRKITGSNPDDRPAIVFFQHDEFIVHTPEELAPRVVAALDRAGEQATHLVLGAGAPAIPLVARVVRAYGEKGTPQERVRGRRPSRDDDPGTTSEGPGPARTGNRPTMH